MSTELTVINPLSGSLLDVASAKTDELARFLDDAKDCKSRLGEAVNIVQREVLRRQDLQAKWTTPAGDYILKGASPATELSEEWDGAELREALLALVDSEILTVEAVDAAVETVITFKPKLAGINAVRKLGGIAAETVNKHRQTVVKPRRVTVSRSNG